MGVKTKEEILESIRALVGEDRLTEDATIELISDVSDTIDNDKVEWKKKYEDNDKDWRKKYTDRFYSADPSGDPTGDPTGDPEEEEEEEEEEEGTKEYKFEDLFKRSEK